jgi:hypothetical protein
VTVPAAILAVVGTFRVTVVNPAPGGGTSIHQPFTVADAPLTGSSVVIAPLEAAAFTDVVARFTDANPNGQPGEFSASINWGDGQTTAGTVARDGAGFKVTGTHTYAPEATYPISVQINSINGSLVAVASTANVVNAPLVSSPVTVPVPVNVAQTNLLVATFTDSGGPEPVSTYRATIDWGDGTAASAGTITLQGTTFRVTGNHTFTVPGRPTVVVAIADRGNGTATPRSTVIVGTANERFVAQAYLDLLERPVDPGGLASWTARLARGDSRATVARQLMNSSEYRTVLVRKLYQSILRRPADTNGLNSFVAQLGRGSTIEQVKSSLYGSGEYFTNRGGGTNSGFLSALFQDALGRAIDPSGLANFTQQLTHGVARSTVALRVLTSREGYEVLVKGIYLRYLRRAADAGGLNNFATSLQHGSRDEDVIASLVGSQEYLNRL